MSKLTVVAKVVAKIDAVAAIKAEVLKLIAPTRQEEGCIEYRLHQDSSDPAVFIFYENWESMSHLERHMNSRHYKEYIAAVEGLITDKVVHKMIEIG